MSLRVGHQINYYSIPLQFSIIKQHKDNLNLSNTDSLLGEGGYDTVAIIKIERAAARRESLRHFRSQVLEGKSWKATESKSG